MSVSLSTCHVSERACFFRYLDSKMSTPLDEIPIQLIHWYNSGNDQSRECPYAENNQLAPPRGPRDTITTFTCKESVTLCELISFISQNY